MADDRLELTNHMADDQSHGRRPITWQTTNHMADDRLKLTNHMADDQSHGRRPITTWQTTAWI
jgi:predicted transposase YbfD/YdcC